MQPSAPLRPAGLRNVHSGSVEAAVIREARRRAWRRRAGYPLVAGLVIVASGVIAIRGMSPPAS